MTNFTEGRNKDGVSEENKEERNLSQLEQTMFLRHPYVGIKFGEFLLNINEWSVLRSKLLEVIENSTTEFFTLSMSYQRAYSEKYKDLGVSKLPEDMNDFLDKIESNKDVIFSRNEKEEIKKALSKVFDISRADSFTLGVKGIIKKIVE